MNNYDTSSKGVNLSLNIYWDTDLSRIYFDESFHVLQHSGMRQHSILVFNWFGNTDQSDFDFEDIENYTFTKVDLIRCLTDNFDSEELNEFSQYQAGKSFSKLDKQELKDIVEYYVDTSNYLNYFEEYFTPTYQILVSRGYRQGDYSEVIFTKALIDQMREELTACEKMSDQEIADYFQEDIDHLLWDSPLYARLEIDQHEYDLDGFQNDRYSYDKQEIIEHVKQNVEHEKLEYIVGWLDENLPVNPDYK